MRLATDIFFVCCVQFAYHCGFVEAVVSEMEVAGIMGTSAGALTGSLLAAGLTPDEICYELSRVAPMEYLSPNPALWQGVLKMDGVVRRLTQLLPPTFDELQTPFACAVVDVRTGGYRVISEGRLPEAVTASAAVPVLFKPVCVPGVPGGPFEDGGKHDRVGLEGLEELRRAGGLGDPRGVDTGPMVHLIERSTPFSGDDDVTEAAKRYDATVVRSPKAGQNLWALNQDTFAAQRAVASERTRMVLDERRAALKSSRRLVA